MTKVKTKPRVTTRTWHKPGFSISICLKKDFNEAEQHFLGTEGMPSVVTHNSGLWAVKFFDYREHGKSIRTWASDEYPIFMVGHHNKMLSEFESVFIYEPYSIKGNKLRIVGYTMEYKKDNPLFLRSVY